ncbi:hypothetical protein AJ88_23775 [Mesorhizobium amorphae CCBAU 01583]|nr:hypothetical protein AJ88_23775 [Mesorhizobium amorphae CCBAU 01583]
MFGKLGTAGIMREPLVTTYAPSRDRGCFLTARPIQTADAGLKPYTELTWTGVANILTAGMLNGLVLGKALTNGDDAFHSSLIK